MGGDIPEAGLTDDITLARTVGLLQLSRGAPPAVLAPRTRVELLRRRWITPRTFEMTDAGRQALARSPFLEQALRQLDKPIRAPTVPGSHGIELGKAERSRKRNRRRALIARAARGER